MTPTSGSSGTGGSSDPAHSDGIDLAGIFVPTTTPFDDRTGALDPQALRSNVEQWMRTPVRGIVIAGTTGEAVLLEPGERRRAIEVARDVTPSDRLLLCGSGAESTRETIRLTREVAEAGADAVLVQPPGFYREMMKPHVLAGHYRRVADEASVPVILYRAPRSCNSIELPAGLVAELSEHPNIVGIKDSRGSLEGLGEYATGTIRSFQVLVGSGSMLYAALEVGAVGGILGVANLVPSEAVAIHEAFRAGRVVEAGRIQERIAPVHTTIVARHGVPGVKAALDMLGYRGGPPRAPLSPVTDRARREIRQVLMDAAFLDTLETPE